MENYSQLHNVCENARKINNERFAIGSKKRLIQAITKKFETAMIGVLARCENQFGFLWGHGDKNINLTAKEQEFKMLWEELRTEILNHCNAQLRASLDEISQYTITWNKYQTKFIVRK